EQAIRMAKDEGHLDRNVDVKQLAFEINAIFFGANFSYQMRDDKRAISRAWKAIGSRLESARTDMMRDR
ncbi:MAG: TetR family transcriptional regulator C-terminal domain-containing protein, partial [Thermoanaerobaculia bacterium]